LLVLARKTAQGIIIRVPPSTEPQVITLTVLDIERYVVRLGVECAREIEVNRDEVDLRKHAGGKQ